MNYRLSLVGACCYMLFGSAAVIEAVSTVKFSASASRVAENDSEALLSVLRSDDLAEAVTVGFQTTDLSAKAGEDYSVASGTLRFEAGQTNRTVRISLINDSIGESVETFSVLLTNASPNATISTPSSATVTIHDNDPGLQVEFTQYLAGEATGYLIVAVIRGPDETAAASVEYLTSAQTATPSSDYTEMRGALSFADAERLKLIQIPILNDGLKEADERFRLALTNAIGTVLGSRTAATITITDNDPGIEFAVNQVWVHEDQGAADIQVLRGNDRLLEPFSVRYSVTGLTATSPDDHAAASGTLEFASGESSKIISVPVVNDPVTEMDERFRIQLTDPTGGIALGRTTNQVCTVTICDVTGMEPRSFTGIEQLSDGILRLSVLAGVSRRFTNLLSVLHLEASPDLRRWEPWKLIGHLNRASNSPAFTETVGRNVSHRYYRMASAPMFSPCIPPSGPYLVGMSTRRLNDASRRNRYDISTNGTFLMTLWYPASPRSGQLPAGFDDEPLSTDIGWQSSTWMDRSPRFFSYAYAEAPLRSTTGACPVIIYSHGGGSARLDNLALAADLASHGYVVASVDHADAQVVVLSDGSIYRRQNNVVFTPAGLQDRVTDVSSLFNELRRLNEESPNFRGQLDLGHVAAMGWSWGGDTAAEFARVNSRCQAVVNLDQGGVTAATAPGVAVAGVPSPSLTLNASGNASDFLFRAAIRDAYWLQISSAIHQDFSAYSVWNNSNFSQGREAARTMHAYVLSFLNRYLKGVDDHRLDSPTPEFPRVAGFKRK